jgi:hypothetical protein
MNTIQEHHYLSYEQQVGEGKPVELPPSFVGTATRLTLLELIKCD